jgi:AraC-like DNA-binding protein
MESGSLCLNSDSSGNRFTAEMLLNILEVHGCEPGLNASTLSENAGMCRMQLYRRVKEIWDKTPSQFIKDYRLAKACDLLSTTRLNVADVAYSVGFSSPSYFIKCFRSRYCCTPKNLKRPIQMCYIFDIP